MSSPNFHAGYLAVAPASPHLSGQREGPEDSPTRPWGHTARVCVCGGVCVENAAPTLASCTEIKIKKRVGERGMPAFLAARLFPRTSPVFRAPTGR